MKPFTTAGVVVFVIVAVIQLVRVIEGWDVVIDGFHVPVWGSIVLCVVPALLAVMIWREHRAARS